MKKTILATILAAAIAVTFAACDSDNSSTDTTTSSTTTAEGDTTTTADGDNTTTADDSGSSDFDTSKNISIVAREDGSGTKSAFMEIIGLKGKGDPVNVIIQTGTAGVLAEVKSNPGAIAYESLGFVNSDVKALKVDDVEATTENIKNGTYKISRPLSVAYKESSLDDALNKAFYDFLQSSDAQDIISEQGYVSIIDNAAEYTADTALSGSIDISGSTSVQPLMIVLAEAFEKLHDGVQINVSGGGTGTGYNNAEEGVSDFGMISEAFNEENAPSCTSLEISKDGIAVIVHTSNPLTSISLEQLQTLYDEDVSDSDAISKWNELID